MINVDYTNLVSPSRSIKAKVELFNGSTLINTFNYNDNLISIDIERVGEESKYFGFGICQKATIKVRDTQRQIAVDAANQFKVYFAAGADYINNFPIFYITEIKRDEKTNDITFTAYDALYSASKHTVAELGLDRYTVKTFVNACCKVMGLGTWFTISGVDDKETCFNTYYCTGANYEGIENLRAALDAVAEVTQTIYYIDRNNKLVFKRLSVNGEADLTITKNEK
jgi:hypothetical protein